MITFYDGLDEAFPEIDHLFGLWVAVTDAEKINIPDVSRKPAPYARAVPRHMNFERDHLVALAEACDLQTDEIPIILTSALKFADNPIIVDAFKKLFSATKLCSDVNETLKQNSDEERERWGDAQVALRFHRKHLAHRLRMIKEKEDTIKAAQQAHRSAWLNLVSALEKRVNAVGADKKKLSEADWLLYSRAKKGTKKNAPFTYLRNQKGQKCADLLIDVRSDLRRRMRERGLKAHFSQIKNTQQLVEMLQNMDHNSANDLFNEYVRRIAFTRTDANGYLSIDEYAVRELISIGQNLKLPTADAWLAHLELFERRNDNLHRFRSMQDHYNSNIDF